MGTRPRAAEETVAPEPILRRLSEQELSMVEASSELRARADLNQATERARLLARTNSRLRSDLRRANRTNQPRSSRSR